MYLIAHPNRVTGSTNACRNHSGMTTVFLERPPPDVCGTLHVYCCNKSPLAARSVFRSVAVSAAISKVHTHRLACMFVQTTCAKPYSASCTVHIPKGLDSCPEQNEWDGSYRVAPWGRHAHCRYHSCRMSTTAEPRTVSSIPTSEPCNRRSQWRPTSTALAYNPWQVEPIAVSTHSHHVMYNPICTLSKIYYPRRPHQAQVVVVETAGMLSFRLCFTLLYDADATAAVSAAAYHRQEVRRHLLST